MDINEYINKLHELIDGSVDDFNNAMPDIQIQVADKINLLIKDLDLKGDRISNTVKNLKLIGKIKSELERIVFNKNLRTKIDDYLNAYHDVAALQNDYFKNADDNFSPSKLLDEIKNQSIEATSQSLTQAGISANVIEPIQSILRQNITTGGKFSDLSNQIREFITTNENGLGALQGYTQQITTDALNQFSAQYSHAVAADLGYEWFMYTGSLLKTSRAFCKALVHKKYYHISELQNIINGDFDGFIKDGNMNPKTDLPKGMVDGTTPDNFPIYRGGYQCGHQATPVSSIMVPESIKSLL